MLLTQLNSIAIIGRKGLSNISKMLTKIAIYNYCMSKKKIQNLI